MTAIATGARRDTKQHGEGVHPSRLDVPVLATKIVKAGSLVVGNSSGTCEPGRSAAGLVALGRAEAEADNSASLSPAPKAKIETGIFSWFQTGTAITNGDRGKTAYVYDDQTVTLDGTSRSAAGVIIGLDDDGQVMVATSPDLPFTDSDDGSPFAVLSTSVELATADMAAGHGTGADTNGTARKYNIQSALPDGAVVISHAIHLETAFVLTGGLDLKVGGTDDDAIVSAFDLESTAGYYDGTAGAKPTGMYGGQQLAAILTPDGSHKVSAATGKVKITVFYIDATDA